MQKHLPEPKVGMNMTLMPEFKYLIILALATLVSSVLLIACDTEPSQTPTQAPTPTSSTIIPTPTDTAAPAPTVPAPEDTPTPTNAPIPINTATHTPAPTDTPIPTPTITPLPTETPTHTPAQTDTPTPIPTNTSAPTETPTFTPTPTNTPTPVPAPTNTPIPTATPAPTPIPADTPVPTPTYTPVPQPVNTPTPEPTATPIPTPTDTPSPTATATIAPSTTNDRDALVAIYNSLDGQYWNDNRNWLSNAPISEWKGVYTDQSGRVVILDLEFRGLNGEIPSELGTLGALQELLIAGNALHGTIPTELSQLSNLVVLDVSTNELTGQVPPELGNMPSLLAVQLSANQLSGCLPDAWRNIQDNDFEATGLPFCGDSPRVQPTPTTTPEPANPQEPTAAPTDTPTPIPEPTTTTEPTATPTSEPTATPTPSSATIIANAFARFNQQRQQLGLGILKLSQPGDSDLIKVQEILVGCDESIDNHDELQLKNLDGIGIYISDAGSECGLKVITYHIIPESKKMKVEKSIWDCFAQSADINTPGDVSCGGRFEAYGRHVKWHPEEILYYTDSQTMRSGIQTLTSWIKEKTKVKVSEVNSPDNANLILYLGDRTTKECPGRAGCSYARQGFGNEASEIFIFQQTIYFNQILKHELLHIILPMGHLPAGNTLMTVQPNDPSQTNNLTSKEEKLLKLYIDPYLRDGMTMDQYKQYLIIE